MGYSSRRLMGWLLGVACLFSLPTYATGPDPAYAQRLWNKYSTRIHFSSNQARQTVMAFNIDCRSRDGRALPLVNVFLAKLASLDDKSGWLTIYVENRGAAVRVHDRLVRANGQVIHSTVAFEINEWGELRSTTGKFEAVRNACFGSQGPIWVLPGSPGSSGHLTALPSEVERLTAEVDRFNSACRGGSGDSPKTMQACEKRDSLMSRIKSMGWCWGPEDVPSAEKNWIRCR